MINPRILHLLRFHDVCQGFTDLEIETIASQAEVVHANADEIIHRFGDHLDSLYLVLLGRLKMSIKTPGGKQQTLRYIAAGDQFGALMLVSDEKSPVNVVVDETAILLRFDSDAVAQLADQFPLLRRNLLRKVGGAIRDSVMKQRKRSPPKLIAFIHADDQTRTVVADVARRLAAIGEKIGVMCDSRNPPYDSSIPHISLIKENGDYVEEADVRTFVADWPDRKRIFIVVDRLHPIEKLVRLVEVAGAVFSMATTDNPNSTIKELKGLIETSPSWKKKMHLVWVMGEQDQVAPFVSNLSEFVERDFKVAFANSATARHLYNQGINRIVHYLRGISIGVALSGGAARGMAHLGVLKALDEAGITIDRLAGTSAGVLTGVLYCAGFSPQWGIDHFTKDLQPGSIFKYLPMGDDLYMVTKYRTTSWDKMLRKYLLDSRLEQLPLPCTTVTADLISAKSIERTTGDSVHSILESINLPVLSPPICRDGMLLVDGGVLNNLPADVLVKQGCNFVIGIDVSAVIEHQVGNNFPDTPTEKMKAPGAITTLMRWLNVQAHNMSGIGAESADVIIAPDVSQFEAAAFTQAPEMAEIGYQATMEAMPRIREILHNLDATLFSD
jgi:predicted acylesterase/phospholipase RssA/CRP-like cAMP-binding protein